MTVNGPQNSYRIERMFMWNCCTWRYNNFYTHTHTLSPKGIVCFFHFDDFSLSFPWFFRCCHTQVIIMPWWRNSCSDHVHTQYVKVLNDNVIPFSKRAACVCVCAPCAAHFYIMTSIPRIQNSRNWLLCKIAALLAVCVCVSRKCCTIIWYSFRSAVEEGKGIRSGAKRVNGDCWLEVIVFDFCASREKNHDCVRA